ncbi:MAG TPA: branched-chain amino acid ABC transporter permease, partial [Actinomycetota bacterium]|nr:branched-chain amino acid ABC transporter permease [Actinomycetota bacterium]
MRTAVVTAAIAAILIAVIFMGLGDPTGPNAFIIIGISQGAIYGLVGIGLVLVYKGARVFNFAQGEYGSMAAFIVYLFVEQWKTGLPYWVAALIAIVCVIILGLIMERIVVRPLMNAPRVTLLVATIAFALTLIGIQLLLFLPEAKSFPPIVQQLPGGGNGIEIFNFIIEPQRLLILAVLAALAGGLGYFFSRTDLGLAVLATSQDAFATRVVGIGVERMSRFIWGSAAFLGAVAGILYVPISGALTPGVMTSTILIPSFTGAVIGGMTSLPGAFVGGVVVGVIQALSNWAAGNQGVAETLFGGRLIQDILPGSPDVVLMLVLLLVLMIRP